MISIASPVLLLLLWQGAAQTGLIDVRFFPAPTQIFSTFGALVKDGSLWDNTSATLLRLLWGGLIGGIPALLLGVATGLSKPLHAVFEPLIAATYPVPKSAIFPLLMLICGLGEASKIAMVAIGVFYPMLTIRRRACSKSTGSIWTWAAIFARIHGRYFALSHCPAPCRTS
ncbi:hypothetical protein [Burkholderia sp. Ax-1724]|uniref:ABC transporter permease n=1 Tax=Burkholderia sp. Ax-1724 TaxID=2608336 RepID=UPI001F048429|nr:hypothetical protein [Burkholderia sp. Ax-1724]